MTENNDSIPIRARNPQILVDKLKNIKETMQHRKLTIHSVNLQELVKTLSKTVKTLSKTFDGREETLSLDEFEVGDLLRMIEASNEEKRELMKYIETLKEKLNHQSTLLKNKNDKLYKFKGFIRGMAAKAEGTSTDFKEFEKENCTPEKKSL